MRVSTISVQVLRANYGVVGVTLYKRATFTLLSMRTKTILQLLLLCTQEVANRGVTTPNIQIHKIAYTDNTIAAQQSPTHASR